MKKINSRLFKLAVGKFSTGVTVISINKNRKLLGKTVNSFSSLSLKPPLILFSLGDKSSFINDYRFSKFIGINILSKKQINVSKHFANKNPVWGNTKYFLSSNNTPFIKQSLANLETEKVKTIKQGDHIIFICKINKILDNDKDNPLIYYNSKYI